MRPVYRAMGKKSTDRKKRSEKGHTEQHMIDTYPILWKLRWKFHLPKSSWMFLRSLYFTNILKSSARVYRAMDKNLNRKCWQKKVAIKIWFPKLWTCKKLNTRRYFWEAFFYIFFLKSSDVTRTIVKKSNRTWWQKKNRICSPKLRIWEKLI